MYGLTFELNSSERYFHLNKEIQVITTKSYVSGKSVITALKIKKIHEHFLLISDLVLIIWYRVTQKKVAPFTTSK